MSGALKALISLDTNRLDARLQVSRGAVDGEALVSLDGFDPRDLLGDLGDLLRDVEQLSDPQEIAAVILRGLQAFASLIDFSGLETVGEVLRLLTTLLEQLEPLVEQLGVDPEALFDSVLDEYGGLEGLIREVTARFTEGFSAELPEAVRIPVEAIQHLAGGPPRSGEDLAKFLCGFVLGMDLSDLQGPLRLVEQVRVSLAVQDNELQPLRDLIQTVTSQIEGATGHLTGENPDLAVAMNLLENVQTSLGRLTGELLPTALSGLADDLRAVDASRLAGDMDAALQPWLARIPEPPTGLDEVLLEPLRSLADSIEAMTPEFLTERLAEIEGAIEELFGRSEVGRLAAEATNLLDGLNGYLQQIPLTELREQLSTALLEVEAKIRSLQEFSPVYLLAEHLQSVESAIDQIDLGAIQAKVQKLGNTIQEVIDSFPIEDLRVELESLVNVAADAVGGIGPALEEADQAIDGLAAQITSIELDAAGAASVQLVQDIRQNIRAALESADLPDAARAALGVVAGQVRKIDLNAELQGPFSSVAARIDIAALVAPLDDAIDQARTSLRKLTPSALIEELDQPFNQVVDGLQQVNPLRLVDALSEQFENFLSLLDQADPRTLITPLQAEYDRLIAELRQAVDPGPLFQPLKEACGELEGLIDRIDPSPLLAKVLARVSGLPEVVAGAARDGFATRLGAGAELPGGTATGAFRFGDILRPFAALVKEIRGAVRTRGAAGDDRIGRCLPGRHQPDACGAQVAR